jgi:hypothetical protein
MQRWMQAMTFRLPALVSSTPSAHKQGLRHQLQTAGLTVESVSIRRLLNRLIQKTLQVRKLASASACMLLPWLGSQLTRSFLG